MVESDGWQAPGGISADGKWLAFGFVDVSAGQNVNVQALRLDGSSKPVAVLTGKQNEFGGPFSPDGSKLAYSSNETGKFEVYVTSFPEPGQRWQISNDGGNILQWTRDGSEILYVREDGKLEAVSVRLMPDDLEIGTPEVLFDTSEFGRVSATADGERFVATKISRTRGSDTITFLSNWLAVADKGGR